ncbi:MAG: NUDIX domain-containing protein [Candidatus Nanohaloarchaea archaeon]
MAEDHTPYTAAYLILEKNEKILLQRRKNTGFKDDMFSLPAGHVEKNETFRETMVREAREEIGIEIEEDDLEHVYTMHRIDGRPYVDVYFRSTEWRDNVSNEEPEKCSELRWERPEELPEKTIGFVKEVIKNRSSEHFYSEKR